MQKETRKPNTVMITVNNLQQIEEMYGVHTKDAALNLIMECILQTVAEVSDVCRIAEGIFVCLSYTDIRGYASQLYDLIGFMAVKEPYPIDVSVKCNM